MKKNKNGLKKVENLFQVKVNNMIVEIVYSENNKSFNECMLEILKRKVKTS